MHLIWRPWILFGILVAQLATQAFAQEDSPSPAAAAATESTSTDAPQTTDASPRPATWNRLIYIPFRELQKVFNNEDATAVVPYAEYVELLRHYWMKQDLRPSPDALISKAVYTASVEEEVARVTVEFSIIVLRQDGWARVPVSFGKSAVGTISSDDDENTILRGTGEGEYELLLRKAGPRTVNLELLVSVTTSPDARTFELDCPAVGINELQVTIPEGEQTVRVSPVEVLLPADGSNESRTVVKAALGATRKFAVRWFPKASLKPQMDLLASVSNHTVIRIEPQLIQTTSSFTWEILRGELREASVLVPADARVIDVVAQSGRIQAWETTAVEGGRQIRIQLLKPVSGKLQIEVQTERVPQGEILQLLGRADDKTLHGVHADGVVRESGRLEVATDSSLTLITQQHSGVKRISASAPKSANSLLWDFSGSRSSLTVQVKSVEPRVTAQQESKLVFGDDELLLQTHIDFMVERAGVFELQLKYPESLAIDSVRADGMSEFNVDQAGGIITLTLTDQRQGSIGVDVRGHQMFDAGIDNSETVLPAVEPLHVERSTGQVTVLVPRFLDVATVEEKRTGVTPAGNVVDSRVGQAHTVSHWNFTEQPWTLAVRTSLRPAQIDATIATTARIDPEVVRLTSEVRLNVRNAGIDTFRIAAPETVADDVRFKSLNPRHVIQQRNKATTAEDGWVIWTLVLQNEVKGAVRFSAEWEADLADADEPKTRSFVAEPLRVLTPFSEGTDRRRRVTLTQARGELRLLRHKSLSITAVPGGETIEAIDVRELEYLPQDGYLAFRYFSQPASATVAIREHELHKVVATVVSKAAIEVVTEKQPLASYRCRYRITTSERQRLRVDVPTDSELQAPSLNNRRTTFEPADDVEAEANWQAYYINISRTGTSDDSFLLSFQLRCPIVNVRVDRFPYEGQGGRQLIRIPRIGDSSGGTVVQATHVGMWTPKDVCVFGEPEHWTVLGGQSWSILHPLESSNHRNAASSLSSWIGDEDSASEFAYQGNASLFRSLGSTTILEVNWRNRPFMVAVVTGTLVLIGLVLRHTSWENRITLILLSFVAVTVWGLFDANAVGQVVNAGFIGLLAVAAIWTTGLLIGHPPKTGSGPPHRGSGGIASHGDDPPPPEKSSDRKPSGHTAEVPPGTVTPAPGVKETMDKLMGGK